jgi:DNA-binding CsgD family transcriptional regulator
VKAVNQISGIADEATIEIRVLPAWYQTWWARIIWLIMIGAAGYYTYIYIKRRAIRKERLRQQEKERRMKEQKVRFSLEQSEKEKELMALRNQQMEYDMKHKSSELADSTMNLVRKNDLLQLLDENIQQLGESVRRDESKLKLLKRINDIRHDIQANLNDDANWGKFEENFNLVYDNFMQKLSAQFPDLKKNDRKLCAYLRMGLSSKEMASLMNTSVRSIETARYRLRKKLNLDNGANLTDFIQEL